jgi:hypothetical protein
MVITVQKLRGNDFMPGFSEEAGELLINMFYCSICELQKKEKILMLSAVF